MPSDFNIQYVAHLARLSLSPAEEEQFGAQLAGILGYIEKLKQLDVTGIEPTAHAVPLVNVFRPDLVAAFPQQRGRSPQRPRQIQRPVPRPQNCRVSRPLPCSTNSPPGNSPPNSPAAKSPPARPCRTAWIKSSAWTAAFTPFSVATPPTPWPRPTQADHALAAGPADRPLARRPHRHQGCHRRPRPAPQLRLQNPRPFHFPLQRHRRGKTAGRRRRGFWTFEHGRIRHGQLHRKFRLRRHPQSLGPHPHPRRFLRRFRRRRRRR